MFNCAECEDSTGCGARWWEKSKGFADHYMRECSQCLPERYHVMVTEDHGERSIEQAAAAPSAGDMSSRGQILGNRADSLVTP